MYAYIKGIVDEININSVVIEANGVGYELLCSSNTIKKLSVGSVAKLVTYLHITQDGIALYGFVDKNERMLFKLLIGVTRVGPKLALAVLSNMTVSEITYSIMTQNDSMLSKVPGMGKKTAARVLLELKESIGKTGLESVSESIMIGYDNDNNRSADYDIRLEATQALIALGYDGNSASKAVQRVKEANSIQDLIKKALSEITR